MSAIDLSSYGREIKQAYDSIVANDGSISWVLLNYGAGLSNTVKPVAQGNSGLEEFLEEFDDGKVQYGFVRVSDPNTGLPKYVLIGWCGEGVPERAKGYFNSHFAAIAKIFPAYHVQVTARSSDDLSAVEILKKVENASGSKYSLHSKAVPVKPRYSSYHATSGSKDEDWGDDAPPVVESEITKVPTAYKPTKVDLASIKSKPQPRPPSADKSKPVDIDSIKSNAKAAGLDKFNSKPEPVKGAYVPIGKVDIAAIRAQAKAAGLDKFDSKPETVKGSYEPIGKVDIESIKKKASANPTTTRVPVRSPEKEEETFEDNSEEPKSLKDRMKAFQQSERLTELPKPKVEKTVLSRFQPQGRTTTIHTPNPLGVAPKPTTMLGASRNFGAEGGKTPAQIWAEKHGKTQNASQSNSEVKRDEPAVVQEHESVEKARDAFKKLELQSKDSDEETFNEKPSFQTREPPAPSFSRPAFPPPQTETEEKEESEGEQEQSIPPPPPRNVPRASEPVPEPEYEPEPEPAPEPEEQPQEQPEEQPKPAETGSTVVAVAEFDYEEAEDNEISFQEGEKITAIEFVDEDWWLGTNAAGKRGLFPRTYVELVDEGSAGVEAAPKQATEAEAEAEAVTEESAKDAPSAVAQYDYDAAEDNEISFKEGDVIVEIDFVDEDWWMGTVNGERGLFPSNYVELSA